MWENVCASAFWLLVLAQFAAVALVRVTASPRKARPGAPVLHRSQVRFRSLLEGGLSEVTRRQLFAYPRQGGGFRM